MNPTEMWLMRNDGEEFGSPSEVCELLQESFQKLEIMEPENKYKRLKDFKSLGGNINSTLGKIVRDWPKEICCQLINDDYYIKFFIPIEIDQIPAICTIVSGKTIELLNPVLDNIENKLESLFTNRQE